MIFPITYGGINYKGHLLEVFKNYILFKYPQYKYNDFYVEFIDSGLKIIFGITFNKLTWEIILDGCQLTDERNIFRAVDKIISVHEDNKSNNKQENNMEQNKEFIKTVQTFLKIINLYGGRIDGLAGPITEAGWKTFISSRSGTPKKTNWSEYLYNHAKNDLGIKEIPGAGSNPRIKHMILSTANWLDPDDSKTAWCACALTTWCKEIGIPESKLPKEPYRARNWINFGYQITPDSLIPGDIIVFQDHVTLFSSWAKGNNPNLVNGFGGNQNNQVNNSVYNIEKALGFVRYNE